MGYYPDGRSDDKGTEPETVEYFSLGGRDFIAVALERCFNNADEDELGTIVPIFEVVDLDAANNDDRVKHVTTLQSPESLSPEGEQKVRLEVLDANSPVENEEVQEAPMI